MPRSNKVQQNKKILLDALEKSLGIVTTACKKAGLNRSTYYEYMANDPEFVKQVKDIENIVKDFVESQLHKQIKEGNHVSTIFYLKTKGRDRGYQESVQVSGDDKQPITVVRNIITKKDKD